MTQTKVERRDRRNAMLETVDSKERQKNSELKKKTSKTSQFLKSELEHCDLLSPLTSAQLDAMVAEMKIREFDRDKYIIKEETDGDEIYVLEGNRFLLDRLAVELRSKRS